jgi:1,4-dihydroxy-2-naphthoate polyprenyltransferase
MFSTVKPLFARNLLLHLRLPFSFFLMPIFLFGASQAVNIDWGKASLVFLVLHFLVYPASNIYNSYMDKDESSISCLKNPPPVSKEMLYASFVLDILSLAISYLIAFEFFMAVAIYTMVSKAYSWDKIRLKKSPFASWLAVLLVQGGLTFFVANQLLVQDFVLDLTNKKMWLALVACSLFTGGQYPLTQVFQHKQDQEAGDKTLSILLGIKGTFVFSALMFLIAGICLFYYFLFYYQILDFLLFLMFFWPVLSYFTNWTSAVLKDKDQANYSQTMKFMILNASCMNGYFLLLLIINQL